MASRRNDEGQVILLAGILLVLAFILFSIQLGVLTNLGQQVGRETENPLLEDYLLVRRSLEHLVTAEIRSLTNPANTDCPDLVAYGLRLKAELGHLAGLESNRGQALAWEGLKTKRVDADTARVVLTLRLSDGHTTVYEALALDANCNSGTITYPAVDCPTEDGLPTCTIL